MDPCGFFVISACLKVVCFKDVEGDITEVPETDGVDVLDEFVTAGKERDDVDNESGVTDEADVIVVDFNVDEIIVGEFDADDDSEDDSTLDVEENDDNSDTSVDGSETTLAVVDVRADVVEFKDVVLGEAAEIVVVTNVERLDEADVTGEDGADEYINVVEAFVVEAIGDTDVEVAVDILVTSVDGLETVLVVVDVCAEGVEFKAIVLGEAAEIVVVTKVDETDEESGNGEVVGSVNGVVKAFPRMLISSIPIMAIAKLLKDRKTICGKKNQLEMLLVYTIQYIV